MKTPMQEIFDQLKASRKDEFGLAFAIDMLLENEVTMLEKEKEVAQQYAEFAVLCHRSELPVLEFDGWVNF